MTTENIKKILVVDDEEPIRDVLQRMLKGIGYEVITATDGQDALQKLSLNEVKVMLLDIKMPNMSGIDVLRKLNEGQNDCCVIMITAVTDMQTAVNAMKLGAYDYITKPFDQEEVKQKLLAAIERYHRLSRERNRYEELQKNIMGKTERMQEQFQELVSSLAREHKLLHQLASRQRDGGKAMLSKLPRELQQPIESVGEFRDALLRILRGA